MLAFAKRLTNVWVFYYVNDRLLFVLKKKQHRLKYTYPTIDPLSRKRFRQNRIRRTSKVALFIMIICGCVWYLLNCELTSIKRKLKRQCLVSLATANDDFFLSAF